MMTRIKLCGLTRLCDIEAVNELLPEYVGFLFWPKSRRYVPAELAESLRKSLAEGIQSVGVFVDEKPENIAVLTKNGIIDVIQLHGHEDNEYIQNLREITSRPIIKAFRITSRLDIDSALQSKADYVMLDSGTGTGRAFDWELIRDFYRQYFLAGGLSPENVNEAVRRLKPFAVDVSSGIETDGLKDREKMRAFVEAVRKESN